MITIKNAQRRHNATLLTTSIIDLDTLHERMLASTDADEIRLLSLLEKGMRRAIKEGEKEVLERPRTNKREIV